MKKICFIIFVLNTFCSCSKIFLDDKLSLQKKPYLGNELKLNGYYYEYINQEEINIYFLYRNGIVINVGVAYLDQIDYFESIINTKIINKVKNQKFAYGLFNIQNNKIKYEFWSSSAPVYKAYRKEGEILNDSTFCITSFCKIDGTDKKSINWLYHFKEFSPKPDSTNKFIP